MASTPITFQRCFRSKVFPLSLCSENKRSRKPSEAGGSTGTARQGLVSTARSPKGHVCPWLRYIGKEKESPHSNDEQTIKEWLLVRKGTIPPQILLPEILATDAEVPRSFPDTPGFSEM
jgi:hypothetical protein